ncbi:MAG: polymer-forming cytoskeletal protein [Ruminococcaceae bacterium]|nr:polymer-forming cytoskeletal protein [Oscillospiraceae bacterium]
MDYSSYKSTSISGKGSIGGGTYNQVEISGSGKVNGDINCASFDSSGSAKVDGNLTCAGTVDVSGAFKVEGNVKCETLDGSGAVKITGNVEATDIDVSGALSVGGDCSAECVEINGGIKVVGLLNAEDIDITISSAIGDIRIGQIGGGTVKIKRRHFDGPIRFVFTSKAGKKSTYLSTELIEADRVELENVIADTVRTIDAVIGDECEIGTLEYSGEIIEISEKAKVGNIVKI